MRGHRRGRSQTAAAGRKGRRWATVCCGQNGGLPLCGAQRHVRGAVQAARGGRPRGGTEPLPAQAAPPLGGRCRRDAGASQGQKPNSRSRLYERKGSAFARSRKNSRLPWTFPEGPVLGKIIPLLFRALVPHGGGGGVPLCVKRPAHGDSPLGQPFDPSFLLWFGLCGKAQAALVVAV